MLLAPQVFTTFNFIVELYKEATSKSICEAEFSDCDGLEMNMEPKTIREGGNNTQQIHLVGPVSYGQLTLKRGMTKDFGLWKWFEEVQIHQEQRVTGDIYMVASDRSAFDAKFELTGCLPIKLKAPSLNAKEGAVAIEEMQIAYETLRITKV